MGTHEIWSSMKHCIAFGCGLMKMNSIKINDYYNDNFNFNVFFFFLPTCFRFHFFFGSLFVVFVAVLMVLKNWRWLYDIYSEMSHYFRCAFHTTMEKKYSLRRQRRYKQLCLTDVRNRNTLWHRDTDGKWQT